MLNGFLGELLGTMILIVFGVGCGAGINLKKTYSHGSDWTFVALAWGLIGGDIWCLCCGTIWLRWSS